jgi:hypothetical protein
MAVRQHKGVFYGRIRFLRGDGGQTYIISPPPLGIVVDYAVGVSHWP